MRQAHIALPRGVEHPQSGPHNPLGVIFIRQWGAKVDEQAIAEMSMSAILRCSIASSSSWYGRWSVR